MDFIPVGFQYYRAPTPLRQHWENDLKKIANDGFNTVKYWIQWRWNEPTEGEFYFEDIDSLMDLADKYGLKVVLNIILDVEPVWLSKKYADSHMVTISGEAVTGYASECRQIGGLPGPCFHHVGATALRMRFVEQCAKRYANHQALLYWDVWNEPELSSGIKREAKLENLLCYCEHTISAFRAYLRKKYGQVTRLNDSWGRNYTDFSQAEPPKNFGTTKDMIDWRLFHIDTLTNDFKMRYEAVKKFDTQHLVMCHTVPIPLFNSITCCSDDFALAKIGDIAGNSVGSNALAAVLLKSASKGKAIINAEIHAAYGSSLMGYCHPDMNAMLRHIFLPLAHGSRGFLLWQYRPETLGSESPAWGNITLSGRDTEWNHSLKKINAFLKENYALLSDSESEKIDIGIFLDNANEIYTWAATRSTELYNSSLMGSFYMFYDNNYDVSFFSPAEMNLSELSKFRAVFFPASFCFKADYTKVIKSYVESGGIAVFEALSGMTDQDSGRHSEVIPGCGISELSNVFAEDYFSTSITDNAYGRKALNPAGAEISMDFGGTRVLGSRYAVKLSVGENVKSKASFADGSCAVAETILGKGRIINIATLISPVWQESNSKEGITHLLKSLIPLVKQSFISELPTGIRINLLNCKRESIIVAENKSGADTVLKFPFDNVCEIFGQADKSNGGYILKNGEIAIFKAQNNH